MMTMNHRITLSLPFAFTCFACTAAPASDDESNVTTAMSESVGDEADTTTTTSDATSSTPPDTDTDGDTSTETGYHFIMEWDIFEGFCDSFDQVCSDGEKCVPYAIDGGELPNANKCVPVLGDGQPGDPCSFDGVVAATDSCNALSRCLVQDGSTMGTCVAFCTGTPESPVCEGDSQCVMGFDGSVADCLPQCHPATPPYFACSEGMGCYWSGAAFECLSGAGSLGAGEPCEFVNDCAPGHLCGEAAMVPGCQGTGCCVPFCLLLEGCQQPGSECVPFFEPGAAPLGLGDLGVCVVPP